MATEPTSPPPQSHSLETYTILMVRCPRCGAGLFHALSPRSVAVAAELFGRKPEEFLRWLCQSKKRLDTPTEDTPLELCQGPEP
jgi:hypothetical protein